jgi:hypothetical protein
MVLSSRGWLPIGLLLSAIVGVALSLPVLLDNPTQAEFAAAEAQTVTSAEPALPLYVVLIAVCLAAIVYMFSSLIVRIDDAEGD